MTQLLPRRKINCLFHGYCKENKSKKVIPIDIIKLCLSFYDPYPYINITKQDINKILTEFSLRPISTSIYTLNGFTFKVTAALRKRSRIVHKSSSPYYQGLSDAVKKYDYDEQGYHVELMIHMIFIKLPSNGPNKFSVISRFTMKMDDNVVIAGQRGSEMFDIHENLHYRRYHISTIQPHELATVESAELSFDFNIINKIINVDQFDDVSYQWIFNKNALNSMQRKEYVYCSEDFGWNEMFYLMIDFKGNKLELYLCVYLINMPGVIKIGNVKVMLIPFNEKEKRKVWRATDIELDVSSDYQWRRRKKWVFSMQRMVKYFSNHSLMIELHGIHLM